MYRWLEICRRYIISRAWSYDRARRVSREMRGGGWGRRRAVCRAIDPVPFWEIRLYLAVHSGFCSSSFFNNQTGRRNGSENWYAERRARACWTLSPKSKIFVRYYIYRWLSTCSLLIAIEPSFPQRSVDASGHCIQNHNHKFPIFSIKRVVNWKSI